MSHVAAGGAVRQTKNMSGKRLGVKKYANEIVKIGNIIVRQRGSTFHPGKNAKMGRDYTIYAVADGYVKFRRMSGYKRGQYYIDVVNQMFSGTSKLKVKAKAKPKSKQK